MISDFLLVIPTKNRHKHLKRTLEFYSKKSIEVLVCDGSEEKLTDFPSYPNIKYLHFPGHTFASKLHYVFNNECDSKYVCLAADDDFLLVSTIEKCISFLEENPAYKSVQGEYVNFFKDSKGSITFKDKYKYVGGHLKERYRIQRLYKSMTDFFSIFYFVGSIELYKKIFNAEAIKIRNLNLIELLMASISVLEGKHIVLQSLFGVREKLPDRAAISTRYKDFLLSSESDKIKELNSFKKAFDYYLVKYADAGILERALYKKILKFRAQDQKRKKYRKGLKGVYKKGQFNQSELEEISRLILKYS